LRSILNLGLQPPCVFLDKRALKEGSERLYPLEICLCGSCGCVQSRNIVNPRILFGEGYHHIAGIPLSFRAHLGNLATLLSERFHLGPGDFVVELGSSDGFLLEKLLHHNVKVLGVEPSSVCDIAKEKGLNTLKVFFDKEEAKNILAHYGRAKVIVALNTFAHVAALDSFMKGVDLLLDDTGVFVTESHYLLDLITKLQYDFIYHEHLRYYSLRTLTQLFELYGMEVFDVERIPTHSGSLRVYAGKKGVYPISDSVGQLLRTEDAAALSSWNNYEEFARRVQSHRAELKNLLVKIKGQGERIVGVTYPARAVTLLQYCQIGPDILDYVTEGSELKVGKFTPGSHIKIVDESVIFEDQPDYGLLLSWHLSDEVISKFRARGYKGKFIIPLPTPRIV